MRETLHCVIISNAGAIRVFLSGFQGVQYMYISRHATRATRYKAPMPLLTIFAEAFITLLIRIAMYLIPMLAGAFAATAAEKVIQAKKVSAKKRVAQRKTDMSAR